MSVYVLVLQTFRGQGPRLKMRYKKLNIKVPVSHRVLNRLWCVTSSFFHLNLLPSLGLPNSGHLNIYIMRNSFLIGKIDLEFQ